MWAGAKVCAQHCSAFGYSGAEERKGGCSASEGPRSEVQGFGGGHFDTCLFAAPFQGALLFILLLRLL